MSGNAVVIRRFNPDNSMTEVRYDEDDMPRFEVEITGFSWRDSQALTLNAMLWQNALLEKRVAELEAKLQSGNKELIDAIAAGIREAADDE